MLEISIFLVDSYVDENTPNSIYIDELQKNLIRSDNLVNDNLANDSYNLSVKNIDINSVPESCDSDFVIFLDLNTFLDDKFLQKAVTLHSFFDDYGVIFTPTLISSERSDNAEYKHINSVYQYYLRFGSSKLSDITGETYNYGPIIGSLISSDAYNDFYYTPCKTPRSICLDNKSFVDKVSRRKSIYYASDLHKLKYLDKNLVSDKSLSLKYYNDGFQEGYALFNQNNENKLKNLWHRFVESPESFDGTNPRWLIGKNMKDYSDYLEKIVAAKCQYQLGFYEGITNKKVIE